MTLKELKELAIYAAKNEAPTNFSVDNVDAALADGLRDLAGSVNQFMKNRYDIYDIIITAVDEVVPKNVMDAVSIFAEVQQVPQGQKADVPQEAVQQAVVLQDGHPGVGPQEEVHPHGQHNQGHSQLLEAGSLPGHKKRHGVANQQAYRRSRQSQPEGAEKDGGVVPHIRVVFQGQGKAVGREGIHRHNPYGNHHKQGHPQRVGPGKQREVTLHARPLPPYRPARQGRCPGPSPPGTRSPVPRTRRRRRSSRRTARSTRSFS